MSFVPFASIVAADAAAVAAAKASNVSVSTKRKYDVYMGYVNQLTLITCPPCGHMTYACNGCYLAMMQSPLSVFACYTHVCIECNAACPVAIVVAHVHTMSDRCKQQMLRGRDSINNRIGLLVPVLPLLPRPAQALPLAPLLPSIAESSESELLYVCNDDEIFATA